MYKFISRACQWKPARFIAAFSISLLTPTATLVADVIPLDLSIGYNYDGYISQAEVDHAMLYNPPANWSLSTRIVSTVFGEHSPASTGSRAFSWDDQTTSGLPANGQLSTSYGTFQLSLDRDAEPSGGFVQGTSGSPPSLPLASNTVRADRPHSGSIGWASATASMVLPVNQQGNYDSVNFLVSGDNRKVYIYADYDDGQQIIYESPGAPKTPSETGFPELTSATSSNADLIAAASMTELWSQTSDYSEIRSGTATMWTFDTPLTLDSSKELIGFTLAIHDTDPWQTRMATIYAAAANSVNNDINVDAVNGSDSTGDGSLANPYQTLPHALSLVSGGETIALQDGSYGNISLNKSGDIFTDWVTIKAATGASPELGYFYVNGLSGPYDQTGGYNAYIRLENLILRDGWLCNEGKHWALVNCLIERIGPWTGSVDNIEKTAVEFRNGTDITIEGCEITNTGIGIEGRGHEIIVRGNHIHDGSHDGIRVVGWWNSLIEDNLIHSFDDGVTDAEATWSRHCDLIHFFIPGPALDGWESNNVVVRYNVLYDTESQGVQFNNYYANPNLRNRNITFEYNVFGPSQANLFNNPEPVDGLIFRHNTIAYIPGGRSFGRWTLDNHRIRIGASTGVEIYNNNMVDIVISNEAQIDLLDWNILQKVPNPLPVGVDDNRAFGRFTQVGVDYELVQAEDFDGALQTTSPSINAGTFAYAPHPLPSEDLLGTLIDIRPDIGAWEKSGESPATEPLPTIYGDNKTTFVDDFEDGHYNDVDDWLNDVAQQGLSWYRPANYDTYKYNVTLGDPDHMSRQVLIAPIGATGQQRIAWLLSEQGSDWAEYDLSFRAFNSYVTSGSGVVVLALDEDNAYWIDISRDNGRLVRILNGTSTVLDTDSDIELENSGPRDYKVSVRQVVSGIEISVDADDNGSIDFTYTDTDPTAIATFQSGGIGLHDETTSIHQRIQFDDFKVDVISFAP